MKDGFRRDGPAPLILLAERSEDLRARWSRVLIAAGWRVTAKPDGDAALLALARSPDAALLVAGPGTSDMTGVELGRAARKRRPDLPVLLIGGAGERASAAGFAVLPSPGDDDALVECARSLIGAGP